MPCIKEIMMMMMMMIIIIIIIIMHDKKEKTCLLSDIAIPNDSNINTKETEKLSKYT